MTEVIFYKVFSKKNKDVFHLDLRYSIDSRKYSLNSNIPQPVWFQLNPGIQELLKNEDVKGHCYVIKVVQMLGELILLDYTASKFFYPNCILDPDGKVSDYGWEKYCTRIDRISRKKLRWVSSSSEPEVSHFLKTLVAKGTTYEKEKYVVTEISRKEFEFTLSNPELVEEYVEKYKQADKFIRCHSVVFEPSFYAMLNRKGEIIIATLDRAMVT